MKYIRTEDSVYKRRDNLYIENNVLFQIWYSGKVCLGKVISQANSIEELCDEIVIKRTNTSTGITWYEAYPMKLYMELYNDFKMITKDLMDVKIHYAKFGIWNDTKGLIYVAKMNEEGELELI